MLIRTSNKEEFNKIIGIVLDIEHPDPIKEFIVKRYDASAHNDHSAKIETTQGQAEKIERLIKIHKLTTIRYMIGT